MDYTTIEELMKKAHEAEEKHLVKLIPLTDLQMLNRKVD